MNRTARIQALRKLINNKIVVLDGAMGTNIQAQNLAAEDFGGKDLEGCNEYLNLTRPDTIIQIHSSFLEAGADIVETNSFGATPLVLAEYQQENKAWEINHAAATLARKAIEKYDVPEWHRFVAGSIGPTTKAISITGGVNWEELAEHYKIQALGLIQGGVDFLLIETSQDIINVKACFEGIDRATQKLKIEVPIAVQCTIEPMGTTLGGQDIESFYTSIAHRDLLWIGMNCATGPEFMRDHLRSLREISKFPVAAIPNAGLPDEDGIYHETPTNMAQILKNYIESGWITVIGGCCGTTDQHIKMLHEIAQSKPPTHISPKPATMISGLETLTVDEDTRPIIVGERTNVLGSRRFKRLIGLGKIEEAAEIGRHQIRNGAHILDVCLQDPDRDEVGDITDFLKILTRKIKAPIMIDSTNEEVIEEALRLTPGKSMINSINLEDGEERFRIVVPLASRYGAALIVGCIDEDKNQAQAITRQRKLEVARKSGDLLIKKYGISEQDIIFDPLVFPIGTGDKNYVGAGVETIEGVRLIKQHFPLAKTILGISNVSFGLPPAGREALNSVFLYHCVQAGLDMAIVNSSTMLRYASMPELDKKVCEDLIWARGEDPIRSFAAHFRERTIRLPSKERNMLPIEERVSNCIIEGTKEGLIEDLNSMLKTMKPLDIINGPLMDGMDEVGKLFASNELIVAEVLESAESMKAAVTHLEPYMESSGEAGARGAILLATVKGDVHDIGKNLVDIILSNNGFTVTNLGIRVPSYELIEACKKYKPDIIGLSGLLVKSAQMMVETAKDFEAAGVNVPIIVGGAALTNRFTRLRIASQYSGLVAYAQDAMAGLDLVGKIIDPEQLSQLQSKLSNESEQLSQYDKQVAQSKQEATYKPRSNSVIPVTAPPVPPDLILHVIKDYDLSEVFSYINPTMLYVRHLGFRGKFLDRLREGNKKATELHDQVAYVEECMLQDPNITCKAVYQFFRAASEQDDVIVFSPNGKKEIARFAFGRQTAGDKLCIADYLQPIGSAVSDYIGMFVTSVGPGVRKLAEQWKLEGKYLRSYILQALALESAEGFAELLHKRMRDMLNIGDPKDATKEELFRAQYTGLRYSFGYPACPRLEDQSIVWNLLDPESNIEVALTEGYMMEPEGSVSAIVVHHPKARYFNLDSRDVEQLENRIIENRTSSI
ncbi:methionine synthase [SAR202 cluster bacterium AD-802-E10_MRT_200m]|nr:methionine synthase [SAR202 cluster bacterium AD-802-E10_MRT_200m]